MYNKNFLKFINSIYHKIDILNNNNFYKKIIYLPYFNYLSLIDIGSSFDIEPRWKKIKKKIKYYGFEPNIKLVDKLKKQNKDCIDYQIYPILVSDNKGLKELNITSHPGVSSVFKPNIPFLSKFKDYERYAIEKTIKLRSDLIDNLNLQNIDFMKIDIQGGGLDALRGSEKTLKDIMGIEVEVEFQQLYKKQPLFGDINNFICEKNFEFVDFILISRWERNNYNSYGQACFADALYLRSPEFANSNYDKKKMINYLVILLLYNKYDLIEACNLSSLFNKSEMKIINKVVKYFKQKNKLARFFASVCTGLSKLLGSEYKSHLFN